jgi:SAM-dependent methyltransferase
VDLYDSIGENYNDTRKADPFIADQLTGYLSTARSGKGVFLDVGCGTGNYTVKLSASGLDFYGIDPSNIMLEAARLKSGQVKWCQAPAEDIPFNDSMFDGVLATLTIHHWDKLRKGLAEIYRVMKPASRLVIFTSTQEQMKGYWLNHYFPDMMERSIKKMPSRGSILEAAEAQGFSLLAEDLYFIRDDLEDLFLYAGKNNPEVYFIPEIRKGISSFSNLADAEEIRTGLEVLKSDMDTDTFKNIQQGFENNSGDYSFYVLEK